MAAPIEMKEECNYASFPLPKEIMATIFAKSRHIQRCERDRARERFLPRIKAMERQYACTKWSAVVVNRNREDYMRGKGYDECMIARVLRVFNTDGPDEVTWTITKINYKGDGIPLITDYHRFFLV
jgi:hypothetical protein